MPSQSSRNPQTVPEPLQAAYTGPDRRDDLPPELKHLVCVFLHGSGEARWGRKDDLKNLNLTCKGLRDFAREHLFRFMTLAFKHEYSIHCEWDPQRAHQARVEWHHPKLVRTMHERPALRPYVRALRVKILPLACCGDPLDDGWLERSWREPFQLHSGASHPESEYLANI